jgi:hypothetical protein
MKITNRFESKTLTYTIEVDVDGQKKALTYKEHYQGHKVIGDELEDENGEQIFDDEVLEKVRELADAYQED